MSLLDCLQNHLAESEFSQLLSVIEVLGNSAFAYSPGRREFYPADGWFLIEPGFDYDGDEASFVESLMSLANSCCDILNSHLSELDIREAVVTEPRLEKHSLSFKFDNPALADRFLSALRESGYAPSTAADSVDCTFVEVPFTALTDWEYVKESDNINMVYTMVRDSLSGKRPKGTRV